MAASCHLFEVHGVAMVLLVAVWLGRWRLASTLSVTETVAVVARPRPGGAVETGLLQLSWPVHGRSFPAIAQSIPIRLSPLSRGRISNELPLPTILTRDTYDKLAITYRAAVILHHLDTHLGDTPKLAGDGAYRSTVI